MIFGFVILITALTLSVVAAFYSISGLVAIFAAAPIPIMIMGGALEIAKVVTTVFLHNNWKRLGIAYKTYLVPAVAILMFLTSIGIFGLLSKAHSDQTLVSGDVQSKISIYDEKIKISRDNIDATRRALKQMDEAVDQVMARSTTEGGADKAVAIRRSQSKERDRLVKEIDQEQKKITTINEERAPIAAEIRKVEADVGPIRYIAALIYGDNPDANLLERAVRWIIILIVIVFDPLALCLILSANKQFEWALKGEGGWVHNKEETLPRTEVEEDTEVSNWCARAKERARFWDKKKDPVYEADDGPLTEDQINQIKETANNDLPVGEVIAKEELFPEPKNKRFESPGWMFNPVKKIKTIFDNENTIEDHDNESGDSQTIIAQRAWKVENPADTLKNQRQLLRKGLIDHLPWEEPRFLNTVVPGTELQPDNELAGAQGEVKGFGSQFPNHAVKGDMFLRVDQLPSILYKYNGSTWIEVDKHHSDNYAYDDAYIDYLITKISSGEYDPELLSEAEQTHIESRLKHNPFKV